MTDSDATAAPSGADLRGLLREAIKGVRVSPSDPADLLYVEADGMWQMWDGTEPEIELLLDAILPLYAHATQHHSCRNCEGVDPDSCLFNAPARAPQSSTEPSDGMESDATSAEAEHLLESLVAIIQNTTRVKHRVDGWQVNGSREAAEAILEFVRTHPLSTFTEAQAEAARLAVHRAFFETAPMSVVDLAGYDQVIYERLVARAASAVLEAVRLTPAQPELVTTDAELNALPVTTTIRRVDVSFGVEVAMKSIHDGRWYPNGSDVPICPKLPAVILYRPVAAR